MASNDAPTPLSFNLLTNSLIFISAVSSICVVFAFSPVPTVMLIVCPASDGSISPSIDSIVKSLEIRTGFSLETMSPVMEAPPPSCSTFSNFSKPSPCKSVLPLVPFCTDSSVYFPEDASEFTEILPSSMLMLRPVLLLRFSSLNLSISCSTVMDLSYFTTRSDCPGLLMCSSPSPILRSSSVTVVSS